MASRNTKPSALLVFLHLRRRAACRRRTNGFAAAIDALHPNFPFEIFRKIEGRITPPERENQRGMQRRRERKKEVRECEREREKERRDLKIKMQRDDER